MRASRSSRPRAGSRHESTRARVQSEHSMPTTQRERTQRKRTLPTTMRAAAIDEFGPPSVLTLHTLPVPTAGPHEILVAVHAAGVGVWDAKIRDGSWAEERHRFPQVLGTDGAGIVVGYGSGGEGF